MKRWFYARNRPQLTQKLIGLMVLIMSFVFFTLTWGTGEDAAAGIIMAMLGLWLIFSREQLLM